MSVMDFASRLGNSNSLRLDLVDDPDSSLVDITHTGQWSLSSAAPKHGLQELHAPDTDLFWQSSALSGPHDMVVDTHKLTTVQAVALHLDYARDETWTPRIVQVQAGATRNGWVDVGDPVTLTHPHGWVLIHNAPVACHTLRIRIVETHQQGRNCQVRGVRVFAARPSGSTFSPSRVGGDAVPIWPYTSDVMIKGEALRNDVEVSIDETERIDVDGRLLAIPVPRPNHPYLYAPSGFVDVAPRGTTDPALINTLTVKRKTRSASTKLPTVMLHGYGVGIAIWSRNLPILANELDKNHGHSIYALDWFGMGRSARGPLPPRDRTNERATITVTENYLIGSLGR
ncbi:Anaphase-promoting complex subunit 10 [Allomyces arbusculus]|nr:Anaphase-promoting complex subunit 10 [Allomyces arbusculus]